jgi:hypothetical protein
MGHPCVNFWKPHTDNLFTFLEGSNPAVGPGDGLDMSLQTYLALESLLHAIEEAVGAEQWNPPGYTGPASPAVLPPEQEDLFRICLEQATAGLNFDRFDPAVGGTPHVWDSPSPPGWIKTGDVDPNAIGILYIPPPPGGGRQAPPPGTDLYGRVKGALGG